ncbi:DUF3618 domain-containing protein [Oceaniglobus indicus]|uniref:DUF3618 domain-containing protein n=1 Tax=Oceaniglobus indicus TaxID=2047749 RepID=UPI000C186530|nr:DUF3618 domain-containing protein [Oceaniglobus indicus]
MTDHRSPEEIERDIERQRAGLTDTLDDLQDRFSIDGIVRQVGDQFREHGGDIGASISRSVRENPMALALTGVGLAWMIFGNRDGAESGRDRAPARPHRTVSHTRRRVDYGRQDPFENEPSHDSRPGRARGIAGPGNTPAWLRDDDDDHDLHGRYHDQDDDHSLGDQVRAAREKAGQRVTSAAGSVSDSASAAAGAVSGATSDAADKARGAGERVAAGVKDVGARAGEAASHAADRAAHLRDRLSEGTESLSEEARERVIAARQRAIEARDAAAGYARQGRDRAADLFDEQPLIGGALALALGAAIGAALPRTRMEDAYMGETSDELIDEAERIYAEERDKATKVARAAMDEVRDVAREASAEVKQKAADAKAEADDKAPADTAAQAVADRAKEAGQRVADAASAEADKQDLGKPRT